MFSADSSPDRSPFWRDLPPLIVAVHLLWEGNVTWCWIGCWGLICLPFLLLISVLPLKNVTCVCFCFCFLVLSLKFPHCDSSSGCAEGFCIPSCPQELLDSHSMHTAPRSKQGMKVKFCQQPWWTLVVSQGSLHVLILFPKKPVKVVGVWESFVRKGFSGGQIKPDEQLRELSHSKPPSYWSQCCALQ